MIRPRPARWFEILAARDDATVVLEALAATGASELEARPSAVLPEAFADVRPLLQRFAELALRYQAYWPARGRKPSAFPEPPAATLERCLACVRAWAAEAEPVIRELQLTEGQRVELELWRRVLEALAGSSIDLKRIADAGPTVAARLFAFPPQSEPAFPAGTLVRRFLVGDEPHALVVGSSEALASLAQQAAALKGRAWDVPRWMEAGRDASETTVAQRLEALAQRRRELDARLEALHRAHGLHAALGDANRLQWVMQNVRALESGELFCWVTGWTSETSGHRLASALDRSAARAILHYPAPPAGAQPPLLLANPAWARPFEVLSRAVGMPSGDEADPTTLVAIAVPLMFGYMFGDVGQGLVILAAGLFLRNRWPLARLFVAGGIAAALFGLLFGSLFGLHGVLPALWTDPLADPLGVLLVPLYGGAVLLTLGLLLNAAAAHWRGALSGWLGTDAWLLATYLALLAGVLYPPALLLALAGAALFCLGHAWRSRSLAAAAGAMGELAERIFQLAINTLSFARVGAFALAHAGLSSAIVALMDALEGAFARMLVLVVGNALVIVLEGLVVSIQTTRLVLFEFFTKFLTAQGRAFRPLPAPPSISQET